MGYQDKWNLLEAEDELDEMEHRLHISLCKEYIYAHIKERITIEDLSEALGVSASYLSRLFKKETGDSVSAYIRSLSLCFIQLQPDYRKISPGRIHSEPCIDQLFPGKTLACTFFLINLLRIHIGDF